MASTERSETRRTPEQLLRVRPDLYPREYNRSDSLLVAFGFRCNLACSFCMVEDVLDVDGGCDLESFAKFASDDKAMRGIRRIIFSGGEATMERELLEYVRIARSRPSIEHVRIQTNATRLGDSRYLRSLLDAGVDEFFVSLHGHDPATCDSITGRPGSFARILDGIGAIAGTSATLITNTVIAEANYRSLREIVELVGPFRPRSMEFWNIWPRVQSDTTRAMLARVTDAQPHLLAALEASEARGIGTVVKFFPRCLLGRFEHCHDNTQPTALIDAHYWDRDPRYDCIYAGICEDSETACTGLSHYYVERFGWEQGALRPRRAGRRFDPRPAPPDVEVVVPTDDRRIEMGRTRGLAEWLADRGLPLESDFSGWRLSEGRIVQGEVRLLLVRGAYRLLLALGGRDEARPCYARTPSFNVSHARMSEAARREILPALDALVERLRVGDDGSVMLPDA